jgi:hypothetical protein
MNIRKASGEMVPFAEEKLTKSMQRSGAEEGSIRLVVEEVKKSLFEGIASRKIYHTAFALLKKQSLRVAAKYGLKQAMMELGPTGYPFERFIAELLNHQGFSTRTGQVVKGHCVNHEIDVIAEKGDKRFMIECKYHNTAGILCDVKIPLYIHARFDDVEKGWGSLPENGLKFHQGWVMTNTKFSEDAIQYGLCIGLKLVGWSYPPKGNLKDAIDSSGVYPLTCLIGLSRSERQKLLDTKLVLCRDLIGAEHLLRDMGVSLNRVAAILSEVDIICTDPVHVNLEKVLF